MAVAVRPGTPLAPPAELARLRELGRGLQSLALRAHGRVRLGNPPPGKGESTAGMLAEPVAAYIAAHNSTDNPPARRARSP